MNPFIVIGQPGAGKSLRVNHIGWHGPPGTNPGGEGCLRFPNVWSQGKYMCGISSDLKFWLAVAKQNFKWVKT